MRLIAARVVRGLATAIQSLGMPRRSKAPRSMVR